METHSHSIRVLVRPPPVPNLPQIPPPPPPEPSVTRKNGVVVVGFIGKRHHDVAHMINKIIDSRIFGSGKLDSPFCLEPDKINPEVSRWFDSRKLSFYHDEEQGVLYLQFSSVRFPMIGEESSESGIGLKSVFEDQELGDLQGWLFMFSVCHVIILIQDGSTFDTQILKKFRILQAAKQTIVPHIRSQNMSPSKSRPRSTEHLGMSASGLSHNPPGKSRGILNRNSSRITAMSGFSSYTALLPGQCTPVLLFVFLDDFTDFHPSGNIEEPSEASQHFSSSLNTSTRPGKPSKGSGSVIVLARPMNKSEGGLKKKLQSSLEAQTRFSIKKCRTLSGFESKHAGPRNGAIPISAPLFSLDASKAVSLVDACSSKSGESLEFAIGLVEEVLDGKATPDSLLLESHHQHANASNEDIILLREFINKQCDLLRGRGSLVANSNSGTVLGVGMAAAAAAAAAASASASPSVTASASSASGKTLTAPELPTLEIWSTSSQLILSGILSAKRASSSRYDSETSGMDAQDTVLAPGENPVAASNPFEFAISHLENSIELNTKFSTLWCQKAFPVAKEVYLDDLPLCYPSSQHEEHLNKALRTFTSMVKGPVVQYYVKKLKDECTSIWISGRQLCDAVSLTGQPCVHQRHDIETLSAGEIKPHSSGFVYLHACACGRSRRLRSDPFGYEAANLAFSSFSECDKLLPAIKLPERSVKGPIQPSSWNLLRIGGARYYDPSKGLIQSGFCTTQNFLLRWTIFLEKQNETDQPLLSDSQQASSDRTTRVDMGDEFQTSDATWPGTGRKQNGIEGRIKLSSDVTGSSNKNITANGGLPYFTMRKPFSEVVAGPAAANSGFPPLFSVKQPLPEAEKDVKLHQPQPKGLDRVGDNIYNQESQKIGSVALINKVQNGNETGGEAYEYASLFPSISGKVVPVTMNSSEPVKDANSVKHVTVYMGFEHECPRGHRFILTLDHLNELGSLYSVSEEDGSSLSVENSMKKQDHVKLAKTGGNSRTRRHSNGTIISGGSGKVKNLDKSKDKVANGSISSNRSMQFSKKGKYQNDRTKVPDFSKDLESDLSSTATDDGGSAFSLLNRNLPLYMNCPHCKDSKTDMSNMKFAGTVSQLQRLFVVTPSFPVLLAADPVIQFELSCLPPSIPDREQKLQFRLGCPVILPPDSFLSLRLPFVYGVELEDGSLLSLKPFENQPQLTACIVKETGVQVVSNRSVLPTIVK